MRAMLVSGFVLAVALLAAAAPAVTLRGIISSAQDGVPMGRAFILVHDPSASEPEYVARNWELNTTDGTFSIVLSPGCYDLFVSESWFHPLTERICLPDGDDTNVKIKLKPDHPFRYKQR